MYGVGVCTYDSYNRISVFGASKNKMPNTVYVPKKSRMTPREHFAKPLLTLFAAFFSGADFLVNSPQAFTPPKHFNRLLYFQPARRTSFVYPFRQAELSSVFQ